MKYLLIITLILFELAGAGGANAQENSEIKKMNLGPAPIEYRHVINSKPDTTGGLQIPGGIYAAPNLQGKALDGIPSGFAIPVSKKDLGPYRGPDVLNPCAFLGATLVTQDDCICQKIMQQISGSSSSGGSGGPTASGPCGTTVSVSSSSSGVGGTSSGGTSSGTISCNTGGSSSGSNQCPSGMYCNNTYHQCMQTGQTCDAGCWDTNSSLYPPAPPTSTDPLVVANPPPLVPQTWFQVTPDGGYQYDTCNYLYNAQTTQWTMNPGTYTSNDVPCTCASGPCSNAPYGASSSSSSGSSTSSSSSGGGSNTTGNQYPECPNTCEPPTNFNSNSCSGQPWGVGQTCQQLGTKTCAGHCRYAEAISFPFTAYGSNSPFGEVPQYVWDLCSGMNAADVAIHCPTTNPDGTPGGRYRYLSCTYSGTTMTGGGYVTTPNLPPAPPGAPDTDGSNSSINIFGCGCSSGSC